MDADVKGNRLTAGLSVVSFVAASRDDGGMVWMSFNGLGTCPALRYDTSNCHGPLSPAAEDEEDGVVLNDANCSWGLGSITCAAVSK